MKLLTAFNLTLLVTIFLIKSILPQGKVYLVLGSDTAIWDGMDVAKYHCYYNLGLFTAVNSNTVVVMSENFRNQIQDSYGNKLKMTWWMIGGNMFRYATNNNVPIGNTMALHLMKKYYGDKITLWGDELSLHYHTFFWSDYDGDGKYWWNQALNFLETKEDFDLTLAQFLLEENIFPVSFRSGWHYMDNEWQNYLNELLPYSLHNDWPGIHKDSIEPTDNNYDWSQASSEFIPYHPSTENYQLPGNSNGWNVRSKYMGSTTQELMNDIFLKASQGTDQLVCLWSHLPDQNFLNEIQNVNNLAHQAELNYPTVKFQYCTAVEAYQLWRQSSDTSKPEIQLTGEINASNINFTIQTNEAIFQRQPFVAIKDRYERYQITECENVSLNIWRTTNSFPISDIAKVGAAVIDTVGNLTTSFINYLSDDKFIDNNDSGYEEIYGNWNSSSTSSWNLDSRYAVLNFGDSAKAQWKLETGYSGLYNIFIQIPEIGDQADTIIFEVFQNNILTQKKIFINPSIYNQWLYVSTLNLIAGENNFIEMSTHNEMQSSKVIAADVLKATAYVRNKQLVPEKLFINIGELSIEDSLYFNFQINNIGINTLSISSVQSSGGNIKTILNYPIQVDGMGKTVLPLIFIPDHIGFIEDTIIIQSDDPITPIYKIPFVVNVVNYFTIADNEDANNYEETGTWYNSVAQAFGNSSRYAYIQNTSNGPTATFTVKVIKNGIYNIYEILPKTVNSADNALYNISVLDSLIDSFYLNQNEGSGDWKNIGRYQLPAMVPVTIKVIDSGESTTGPVIRADAFKLALFQELTGIRDHEYATIPSEFKLYQNYPNPFNPSTKISWQSPVGSMQTLKVYDVLGNEVATLVDEYREAGKYEVEFDANGLASGMYLYRLQVYPAASMAGSFIESKKMLFLK